MPGPPRPRRLSPNQNVPGEDICACSECNFYAEKGRRHCCNRCESTEGRFHGRNCTQHSCGGALEEVPSAVTAAVSCSEADARADGYYAGDASRRRGPASSGRRDGRHEYRSPSELQQGGMVQPLDALGTSGVNTDDMVFLSPLAVVGSRDKDARHSCAISLAKGTKSCEA